MIRQNCPLILSGYFRCFTDNSYRYVQSMETKDEKSPKSQFCLVVISTLSFSSRGERNEKEKVEVKLFLIEEGGCDKIT